MGTPLQLSSTTSRLPSFTSSNEAEGHFNEKGLPEALSKAALEQYNWMTKTLDVHPIPPVLQGGQSVPRSHQFTAPEVIKAMTEYAKKLGVAIQTGISGKRLLWDEKLKKICGVEAADNKNNIKYYKANNAVIITSGGFARNPEVLRRFNPYLKEVEVVAGAGSLGDGLLMAQAYGADTRDMGFIEATYGAMPHMKSVDDLSYIQFNGAIVVNKAAHRFVNESGTYMDISHQAVRQPNSETFTVFDKGIVDEALKTPSLSLLWQTIPEGKVPDYLLAGATIEEVAEKAGLNPDELRRTIEEYNADVEKGRDSKFGREHLEGEHGELKKIEKPPFYIFPTSNVVFGTYCGLLINPQAQVIDVFGNPIPGLYAAGEVTGGLHGAGYMSGSGYSKALSFGRIAGQQASQCK